jgi:hypothetical protein
VLNFGFSATIAFSPSSAGRAAFLRSRLHPFLCFRNFAAQNRKVRRPLSQKLVTFSLRAGFFLFFNFDQLTWISGALRWRYRENESENIVGKAVLLNGICCL